MSRVQCFFCIIFPSQTIFFFDKSLVQTSKCRKHIKNPNNLIDHLVRGKLGELLGMLQFL